MHRRFGFRVEKYVSHVNFFPLRLHLGTTQRRTPSAVRCIRHRRIIIAAIRTVEFIDELDV